MRKFNNILVIDFETYYNTKEKYSLKNMTNEEYIRDPRFKVHGAALKTYGQDDCRWVSREDLPAALSAITAWSDTAVLAHNAIFDATILMWEYKVQPAFIIDTLSMSRAVHGPRGGNSLADLAERFALPSKGTALAKTDGVRDLDPETERELADYCKHDNWLCEQIFREIRTRYNYPVKELRLIDMILRMYLQPRMLLDEQMLQAAVDEERRVLAELLTRLNIQETDLASDDKFAEILSALGVEVPMKTTPKGNVKPAFAKTDAAFQALLESDNDNVSTLCEARLKVKSTQARTRAQRLIDIAKRGALPVPLHYYGALTGRVQAARGQAINMQNMKRGSFLRKAIYAPKGYVCAVVDLAQIEPRVLAWYAGNTQVMEIFRSGKDVYSQFGAGMFGIPGMTKESHPVLRQSAKSALLGCGYGLSWFSFAAQLLVGFLGAPPVRYDMAFLRQMKIGGDTVRQYMQDPVFFNRALEVPHTCTESELLIHCIAASEIIRKYRASSPTVTKFWKHCQMFIDTMLAQGNKMSFKNLEVEHQTIWMPNGMALRYPELRMDTDTGNYFYKNGKSDVKIYGSKLTENIVQAIARIVMTDGMLRIQERYPVALTVHDEAVAIIPESEAAEGTAWMVEQMTLEPSDLPGIPLAAEGGFHERYGEAK
jgi:DNA polymerase